MNRVLLLAAIFTTLSTNIFGQDNRLILMSGKIIPIKSVQVMAPENADTVLMYTKENGKTKEVFIDEVFSVFNDGKEHIYYSPDPLVGEILKKEQMKSFIMGKIAAKKVKTSPWVTVGGFGAGVLGAFIPSPEMKLGGSNNEVPVGLLVPFAYSVVLGSIDSPNSKLQNTFPNKINNDYYIMGCNEALRKKKFRNSIIGGIAGFIGGVAIVSALN